MFLMNQKVGCIFLQLLMVCLMALSSLCQNCGSKNGHKICCSGFWYNHLSDQCLKCPNGSFGKNCSDVCPYPNFGELCRHKCNCSLRFCHPVGGCLSEGSEGTICSGVDGAKCCNNYWYKKEIHECVECNPGYSGANCAEVCPFPLYGVLCAQSCNCSEEDCNHATGCSIPNNETNDTTSISEKIDEFTQKRFYLRVGAYIFVGILVVFVLSFIRIEMHQKKRRLLDEQKTCTENAPAYEDIIINEENGGLSLELEHGPNEHTSAECVTNAEYGNGANKTSIMNENYQPSDAMELSELEKGHLRCDLNTNYTDRLLISENIPTEKWHAKKADVHGEVHKKENMSLDDSLQVEIVIHDLSCIEICCDGCVDGNKAGKLKYDETITF